MLHRRICCRNCFRFFVPGRIIVPGNKINNVGKLVIIQSLEIIHHIDGRRLFGTGIPQRADLPFHKIGCLICYKSFPVQIQSVQRCVSLLATDSPPDQNSGMYDSRTPCSMHGLRPVNCHIFVLPSSEMPPGRADNGTLRLVHSKYAMQ